MKIYLKTIVNSKDEPYRRLSRKKYKRFTV